MNAVNFIFKTKIGWTLIAFLVLFAMIFLKIPRAWYLIPIGWMIYVFIIGTIGAVKNFYNRWKENNDKIRKIIGLC